MKKLLCHWPLALCLCFSGCAGKQLTPRFVGAATTALVSTTLRNSPATASEMKLASEVLCAAAGGTNVSPQTLHDALSVQNFSLSTIALLNGLQLLYTQALSSGTRYTARDYAIEVFCIGIPAGLDLLPSPTAARLRALPPPVLRPAPKPIHPEADDRFPLWEK